MAIKPRTPLIHLQRRLRRVGKLRTGHTVSGTSRAGKPYERPERLEHWRLTSSDRSLLEHVSRLYGGEVQPWEGEPGQYELYTNTPEIFVRLHTVPTDPEYRFYKGGACHRWCDGTTCRSINGDTEVTGPCICNSGAIQDEKDACKVVLYLDVELAGTASMGCWTLETHSIFACQELPAQVEFLMGKAGQGCLCKLAIEPREHKDAGGVLQKYNVPVLRWEPNAAATVQALGGVEIGQEMQALGTRQAVDHIGFGTKVLGPEFQGFVSRCAELGVNYEEILRKAQESGKTLTAAALFDAAERVASRFAPAEGEAKPIEGKKPVEKKKEPAPVQEAPATTPSADVAPGVRTVDPDTGEITDAETVETVEAEVVDENAYDPKAEEEETPVDPNADAQRAKIDQVFGEDAAEFIASCEGKGVSWRDIAQNAIEMGVSKRSVLEMRLLRAAKEVATASA